MSSTRNSPGAFASAGARQRVATCFADSCHYPSDPPFHPHESYPEYPFGNCVQTGPNPAYAAVRECFRTLGLDEDNFGSKHWNPFRELISPGDAVLLKPNFIKESRSDDPDQWLQIITHGSIIRAVADYVYIALQGKGRLIVADGPQTDSNFERICARTGLRTIQSFFKERFNFNLEVYDLRLEYWKEADGVYIDRTSLPGDPAGTLLIDLGKRSHFPLNGSGPQFYGAYYDIAETNYYHSNGRHTYAFCRTPLIADVIIHLPKLKTHKKCGITVNLKGLIGLNGNKNLLPHYRFGSPETEGDQFPNSSAKHKLENLLVTRSKKLMMGKSQWPHRLARALKRHAYGVFGRTGEVVRSGNWYANDTIWRTALDLNAILTYADASGILHDKPQRKFFSVVDGIIAGEGNGPMEATAKECGTVIAGQSPVLVDAMCARLMGFDYRKIPLIANALTNRAWKFSECLLEEAELRSNRPERIADILTEPGKRVFEFEPHFGWKGHVELNA